MGAVHFHLVATQGGDERRARERRGNDREHGLLTLRKVTRFQFATGNTTVLDPFSTRIAYVHRRVECMY